MVIKLLFLAHNLLLSPKNVQRVGDDHGDDIMLKRRYNGAGFPVLFTM